MIKNKEYILKYEHYLTYVKQLSTNTITSYCSDVVCFIRFVDKQALALEFVTHEHIHDFLVEIHDQKKGTSINRMMSALHSFYQYVSVYHQLKNPMDKVEFKHHKAPLPSTLYIHDIMALLASFKEYDVEKFHKMIVYLLLGSGLRVSELVMLTFSNYYANEGMLRIVGKGNVSRWIPVHDKAKSLLDEYLSTIRNGWLKKDTKKMLINKRGNVISRQYVYEMIRKQGIIANIKQPMSPHTLRHGFATILLDQGADLRLVQELLGHKSISTTQIYTHLQPGKLHKSYDAYHPGSKINKEMKEDE